MVLVAAGPLIVAAALLHPSRETAATIMASESRLVAAHVLFTFYGVLVMLGLPGLYAAHRVGMGRLGLTGFLVAMLGTYLIAVTGYFGFLAPALARQAPARLDTTIQYPPVVVSSGVTAITFIVGYALFGIAMTRTATLPRLSGVLVAVGGPMHLLSFGISQLVSTAVSVVAVMGRLGFAGFLISFCGIYLLATTGYFGFLAPVLATESPAEIDAIVLYTLCCDFERAGRHRVHGRLRPVRYLPGKDGFAAALA